MHLVRQPSGSQLCLACCVAMLTDQTLEDVLLSSHILRTPDGGQFMPNNEAIKYLASKFLQLGASASLEGLHVPDEVDEIHAIIRVEDFPALLDVPSPNFEGYVHAVVWDNAHHVVLDPLEPEPRRLSDYPRIIRWTPVTRLD